jgi:hypothetical protein
MLTADNLITPTQKIAIRMFIAKWLIRFDKLKPAEYSSEQLSDIVAEYLPITLPVSVPTGEGSFTVLSADVCMPQLGSIIQVDVLSSFAVEYLANPLYRAHLKIVLEAKPIYDVAAKEIRLADVVINEISLLQDEYSLLNDTRELMNVFVSSPLLSMFSDTVKTAFSIVTGTSPTDADVYLKLYLGGSKQRILDYHKPQIQTIMTELLARKKVCYRLDESIFEEQLFAKLGKEVVVEDGKLRFNF